ACRAGGARRLVPSSTPRWRSCRRLTAARSTGRPRGGVPSGRARTTCHPAADRRDSGRGPTRSEIAPRGPPAPGAPAGSPSARSAPPDYGPVCLRRAARGGEPLRPTREPEQPESTSQCPSLEASDTGGSSIETPSSLQSLPCNRYPADPISRVLAVVGEEVLWVDRSDDMVPCHESLRLLRAGHERPWRFLRLP